MPIAKSLQIPSLVLGMILTILPAAQAQAPAQPSISRVEGNQLLLRKRLPNGELSFEQPFIIRGVNWQPAGKAPDNGPDPNNTARTIPYGFFFDRPDVLDFWLRQQPPLQNYLTDIPLMKQLNINAVRLYGNLSNDPREALLVLDEFYRNDIMVILTIVNGKSEIDADRHIQVVNQLKSHPAILMWSIGNEWNLDYNLLFGYPTVAAAADKVNQVAGQIKGIDPNHAVTSVLGDRFSDGNAQNTVRSIVRLAVNVDIWGMNIYRGGSFGSLFAQWGNVWAGIQAKPFYVSEYGTDSFKTKAGAFRIVAGQADDIPGTSMGSEDQSTQAAVDVNLWNEIKNNLFPAGATKLCAGGFVFEFKDSWWKVGNYHVGLGGLVDYNSADPAQKTAYKFQNPEGFYLVGAHPDNVSNEEFFGLLTVDRQPKQVFGQLAAAFAELPPLFIRGDANCDGQIDIADVIFTLEYLFMLGVAPGCLDAADSNDDGAVDIADAVTTLFVLFEGASMAAPYPNPGFDPTPDTLTCLVSCPS